MNKEAVVVVKRPRTIKIKRKITRNQLSDIRFPRNHCRIAAAPYGGWGQLVGVLRTTRRVGRRARDITNKRWGATKIKRKHRRRMAQTR